MWKQWINALLGAAIAVAAFMGATGWAFAVMGAIVLVLSLWAAAEVSKEDYDRVIHQRHSHA